VKLIFAAVSVVVTGELIANIAKGHGLFGASAVPKVTDGRLVLASVSALAAIVQLHSLGGGRVHARDSENPSASRY
jgi:hypothetical protein